MRVYKYELIITDGVQKIAMPGEAKVLHLETPTHGVIWLWALVDPAVEYEHRQFQIFATGAEVQGQYIGTVTPFPLVWHVWEVGRVGQQGYGAEEE